MLLFKLRMIPTMKLSTPPHLQMVYFSLQVGTSRDGQLDLTTSRIWRYDATRDFGVSAPTLGRVSCPDASCPQCVMPPSSTPRHVLVPGDILIGGLFPVRDQGDSNLQHFAAAQALVQSKASTKHRTDKKSCKNATHTQKMKTIKNFNRKSEE